MRPVSAITALAAGLCASTGVLAHVVGAAEGQASEWLAEPWALAVLVLSGALYTAGVLRIREKIGAGRILGTSQIAACASALAILFIALETPLDVHAEELFSLHMIQHLLLIFAAAPLFVWGRPAIAFLWAFRAGPRRKIGRVWSGAGLGRISQWAMHPSVVWVLFSATFVFWHFPAPYAWAFDSEIVHALEHITFFATAAMFWTLVFEPAGRRRMGYGPSLLYVVTTAMLGKLAGALLVLAPHPLYSVHAAGTAEWGISLMEDQQLAGVIMWIPAGLFYVGVILWLLFKWLQRAERDEVEALKRRAAWLVLVAAVPLVLTGCGPGASAEGSVVPGNTDRGIALIRSKGCGSCHSIPGINDADGLVGPPLDRIGRRIYLAGVLRNTPENMMLWIRNPQKVVPGNVMPDMGITRNEAQDIVAYLYTLR